MSKKAVTQALDALRKALAQQAQQAQQEPVAWKHSCAALLVNDLELWIDHCPHCGKPRATPPAQQEPVAWVEVKDTYYGPYEFHGKELLPVGKHDLYTSPPQQEPVAAAWDKGYRQGVEDERTSEANIGIAGFGAKVEPARQNPYGTTPPQQEPVAWQDTANHMEIVSAEDWENIDPMWHWMYRPLYTSPPAQQEPVAKSLLVNLYNTGYKDGHHDTVEGQYTDVHQSEMDTHHLDVVANWLEDDLTAVYMSGLYDGKKQRTWVGLTEEERSKIESEVLMRGENYPEVLAAIEAKLKEKNT